MDLKIFIDGKYILTEKIFNTENEDFMVPFSLLSKLFGANNVFEGNSCELKLKRWGIEVIMKAGSKKALVNGKQKLMPIEPLAIEGSIMVPLRFVCEQIGAVVDWDKKTGTIIINTPENKDSILLKVYIKDEDRLVIMDLEEYVKGAAAAEIPLNFHEEAVRAITIALRTFAVKRIRKLGGYGCRSNGEADICTDQKCCQGWISKAQLQKIWQNDFNYNWSIIQKACSDTKGLIITFNNNPIDAVYHLTCGGSTENSESIWGNKVSYLRKVGCTYCSHSPYYRSQRDLPLSELENKLGISLKDGPLNDKLISGLIEKIERTPGSRIKKIVVGEYEFEGRTLLELFNLPSTRFWWDIKQLKFLITGSGHGVGLCKYGADGMARSGKTVDDILTHYYTGVKIERLEDYSFKKPLKGKVITIDQGYGGNLETDTSGILEEANRKICGYLSDMLKEEEAIVIQTREKQEGYISLSERVRIANEADSDLFISIHQNTHKDKNVSGTETFYYPGDRAGKRLAECIQESLLKFLGRKNRGVKEANFYVLRETNMASVLVEVVFITNLEEACILEDESFLKKTAEGILSGILKYYRV
ncbi:MAG TPA: stage II sporulation protein D [Thermoanaerobacterales bacterium]|nr:stage II sporulation protein D [Thermoanaerobacterales bacterium]